MPKIVPLRDIGIPVPATPPPSTSSIGIYYGSAGFTPDYGQSQRLVLGPIATLTQKTVNGVSYYDDPISTELPTGLGNGDYDVYFTFIDLNGDETDFSPKITITVNNSVPPAPGQPVLL